VETISLDGAIEAAKPDSQAAPVQAPAEKEYKIGDTGPAGGIVFYDKGVFEAWRYLEAAPRDFTDAQWGAYGTDIKGTKTEIGSGKENTRLIADRLKQLGETGRAAQLCAAYNLGGYTDWFLPSQGELNLMYRNLKQKGLGDFQNAWYWSSSQSGARYAWLQFFYNGDQGDLQGDLYKDMKNSVRPIRAF
jgi:hypothetical protein